MALEAEEPGLKFSNRFEICWGKDLSLNNRKVDFNLVEPTCVDWRVNGDDGRPALCESVIGENATMRRAVIHNPKYPLRRSVRLLAHNLINQPLERLDSGFSFASAKNSCTVDIPSGKIGQSAFPLIFMFNTYGRVRFGRECFSNSFSRLDAGLLISGDYKVSWPERRSHPSALIQVQDRLRLADKFGITRKNPAPVPPWFNGILTQPPPDSDSADTGNNSAFQNMSFNFFTTKARQRYPQFRGKFTSQCFNFNYDSGGKTEQGARVWIDRTIQPDAVHKTACATCLRSAVANRAWHQFHHWKALAPPEVQSWRHHRKIRRRILLCHRFQFCPLLLG